MIKKKKAKKTIPQPVKKVLEEQKSGKNNTLIFGGVLVAMCSIGLLIFVLSEKVFKLSWNGKRKLIMNLLHLT